ncbi:MULTISPECIES: 2Fe-2S iron-sulfur cluster-binding protein [unclassified Modestobacter]|uniref:2Fe-2S iron-sulfur cluster-binding protein n=1 Tax=unclassified Modestobacter TaxID=2643866 RepID=UPI0022A9FF44|nr:MULTISPECIES: 2Fe-2S iron-sulfur cluster-binding protein [unclassified Modestobacter]MCZ2826132.1 2Fe-2S iron-sulfur cluster-binding protein [Modestobacter sp. VKM Ac-2981]MCZ2852803.1 2Fe-2S iron-sulfur cluster-binding protein [Modestobacter sp. VKM Ac-2982]
MTSPFRTAEGGRIDRATTLEFTFDGQTHTGHPGDTLASALLAAGRHQIATSIKLGRPRGIAAAWAEDPGGLVQIEEPFPEPMLLATTVELHDGLVAHGLPGQGRLAEISDSARYDAVHHHVDVLVVGAGPAGLAAALTAARSGARVALVDDQSEAGGSLLAGTDRLDGAPAPEWVAAAVAELAGHPEVLHLQRTTAFGSYDDGFVLALERRTDHLGTAAPKHVSRQRVWRLRARSVVVATGAHERPVVFSDNDRPGTMLAGAARTFLHRYGVLPGREAVVFTTNDSAYDAALDLHRAGVRVQAVVDARPVGSPRREECERAGIRVLSGAVVTGTQGVERVTHALVARFADGEVGAGSAIACDLLLVSGGWNPAVHLFSQARGRLRYDEVLGAFLPAEELEGLSVTGAAAGVFDLAGCLADGQRVARAALTALAVRPPGEDRLPTAPEPVTPAAPLVLWRVPDTSGAGGHTSFVDLQRDATVADIERAVGAGLRSIEHIKRYTTIGTAHDQGKTSGVLTSGITAELLGIPVQATGTTTFRPPYTPVAFAALAGRDRGRLFDPERVTSLHDWHVAAGAVFEDVGQWKRPRFYPRPGEGMEAAVLRECVAARTGVGILDGSTLGKIDVQGPDAAVLLDRLYTNMISSLKVGSVRYGVMCGVDGMVIDDGTVLRLAEDRFLLLTTTGGAAKVLDWMEEWAQTEWPDLRVHCTSVTEQWNTFPVVGPRSRDVIGAVFPQVDVANEAFPFMTWRDTTLDGVPVRLARISFSGELAFEVYVNPWYGVAVWERLLGAGRPCGITPYGTETMHVLRAEKGYPIIGQDTDGTVTPHDLGMAWAVSKKKPDFVGKRSFARQANQDPLRKQLVGLLPVDRRTVLPEGSQIVELHPDGQLPPPPVPMLGHVTSSYRSAELARPFALALVKGGRSRIGDTVHVPVDGTLVPVEVTGSVLVDPEGARRDG